MTRNNQILCPHYLFVTVQGVVDNPRYVSKCLPCDVSVWRKRYPMLRARHNLQLRIDASIS